MAVTHSTKVNGRWYRAGENISPADTTKKASDNASGVKNPAGYTKTDIYRMTTAELQSLAAEQGIEKSDMITGGELKKILIEKFGL